MREPQSTQNAPATRRVVVTGDDQVLAELATHLTGDVGLVQDRDGWALTSPQILEAVDTAAAREMASTLISELNGLLWLESRRNPQLGIGHVVEVDEHTGRRLAFHVMEGLLTLDAVVAVVKTGEPASARAEESDIERGLRLRHDRQVALVLGLLAAPVSWPSLYRVLDAVEDDVGGQRALEHMGWVRAKDLRRLTRAANAIENAGSGGRHARRDYTLMGDPDPMQFREAEDLIRRLVREWMRNK